MPRPAKPSLPLICLLLLSLLLCRSLAGQATSEDAPDGAPPSVVTDNGAADTPPEAGSQAGPEASSEADTEVPPVTTPSADPTAEASPAEASPAGSDPVEQHFDTVVYPLITLGVGVLIVLGLIIGLRINAFIALITAAVVVSLMAPGAWASKISRVASAFGEQAGNIGIVIAMAAVIGKCMLDSGAADRVVRAFLSLLGEKRAPIALMGSGFVLAVPVFFDTVFYLLVPLARSLFRKTNRDYLKYLLAIGAGGAITHTLVPPTPGPLLMASNLNFDVGVMMLVGGAVALPAAIGGLVLGGLLNRMMPVPMRQIGTEPEPKALEESELPSLASSLAPVLLPVLLISTNTVLTTIADNEHAALLQVEQVEDWPGLRAEITRQAESDAASPGGRVLASLEETTGRASERAREVAALLRSPDPLSPEQRQFVVDGLNTFVLGNKQFYQERAFLGLLLPGPVKSLLGQDRVRMKKVDAERLNRLLLETSFNSEGALRIQPHVWETPARKWANWSSLFGNANLALLLSAVVAMAVLVQKRGLSWKELAHAVEISLMSGGVIILITAGGGAFGAMLKEAGVGEAIRGLFQIREGAEQAGMLFLGLGFLIAVVLKIAQGSSTVAMITGSAMLAGIAQPETLGFHPVYLATAIGGGSLVGSWMNDSGFWIFAKMGGLTEAEALKSWTVVLVFLGVLSFLVTLLLAKVMPLV